jgi:phosphoribosylglycinamide formyltransferase 1
VKYIAVLISGAGTTLQNIYHNIQEGFIEAEITQVISSNLDSPGFKWAESIGLPCAYRPKGKLDSAFYSYEITRLLTEVCKPTPDLVVLAGWIHHFCVHPSLVNRVVNIHPSLLPDFGGKGMYGKRVHSAVLKSGVKYSGCTVHFVTPEYDAGPIIAQDVIKVYDGDTVETLSHRVKDTERRIYPIAIKKVLEGNIHIDSTLLTEEDKI